MKLKATLILAIIFSIIGAGVATYLVYFTPKAQARNAANSVMRAASAQDEAAFKKYGTPKGADKFYEQAAQRNYLEKSDTQSEDEATYYFIYTFTDELSPSQARIGVSNNKVTSLTTGDKLGSTPDKDPKKVAEESVQSYCLSREDLAFLDSTRLYAHTFRGATMIFENDTSTQYAGEENGTKLLNRMGSFYERTAAKDYSYLIRGYLASNDDSVDERTQVVQNRTARLLQELVKRGIPEDRIRIGEPVSYDQAQTTASNERYVIIDIINNCNE